MGRLLRIPFVLVTVCGVAWVARAADADVEQTVGHGQVNWTKKTVTATGSGAPNLKAANVAVARLGAERAAKMDALRNILEAVRGIRVGGSSTAGDLMASEPTVKSKVEGLVRRFKVLDTKYYSDGGVDVIVQVPLDGVLAGALVSGAGTKKASGSPDGGTTGLVINAKGLKAAAALSPTLVDESGAVVYGSVFVDPSAVSNHGVAGFSQSLDAALKDARVASKPLIVKPLRLAKAGAADLVVSAADAAKIRRLGDVLGNGKVIIVID